jgi:hypothetical protein
VNSLGGAGGAGGKDAPVRPKNLVVPLIPHTESVTGKANADRIAGVVDGTTRSSAAR